MKSFHFDLGNSTDGPIGLCGSVTAETREEALELFKGALPEDLKVPISKPSPTVGVEYIQVYFNQEAITVEDIDYTNEVEEEK